MCYKGKCLCLEVETGALIYAILNVIQTSVGSIVSIGLLIYFNMSANTVKKRANESGDYRTEAAADIAGLSANVFLSILTVVMVTSFGFTVALLVGICKRSSQHVKAFFVYGVVNMCIASIGILVAVIIIGLPFGLALTALIPFTIHGLILHMIRLTYLKFQAESVNQAFPDTMALRD